MNTTRFLKRLLNELPRWQERGWISAEGAEAIVADLRSQDGGSRHISYALAIFGVLLLGAGIITWLAANWQEIGRLGKLVILLGSLYAAYAVAGYLLHAGRYPRIGQAILLLGVILFGANIMLIAQIYHIDAHYPNGVLHWALGGLVTAYLLKSEPALFAAMVLALVWSGMEGIGYAHVHWWYLAMWMAFLPAVHLWRWQRAFHFALITLCLWSILTLPAIDVGPGSGGYLYVLQLYFMLYLALFILGMLLDSWWPTVRFAGGVQALGMVGTLTCGYFLTFPDLQSGSYGFGDYSYRLTASAPWVYLNLAAAGLVALLSAWHYMRVRTYERMRILVYGRALIGASIALMLVSLFVGGVHGGPIAILLNLLFFGGVIWLVFAGMNLGDRLLVNLAFAFFAATLVTRYFDTFWTLLNRSFFFIVGGVILIVGGYLLERQRRRITDEMAGASGGGLP